MISPNYEMFNSNFDSYDLDTELLSCRTGLPKIENEYKQKNYWR